MLESRLVGFYYEGHLKEVPVLFLFSFCCCPFYTSGFVERLSRNFQQQTRPRYQLKTADATNYCSQAVGIC